MAEFPLLPLDSWRAIIGYHPYHFWGLADTTLLKVTSNCNTVVREHTWQDAQAIGRADIRRAIASAERQILQQLGYAVAPRPATFTVPWPTWHDPSVRRLSPVDAVGDWLAVTLPEGQIQACGVPVWTLLGTPALALSDQDSDGVYETFTATLTVAAGTDPATIRAVTPAADRLDGAGASDATAIQPITASVSGTTLTITGRAWLLVRPARYQGFGGGALDPATAGVLLSSLEVYAVTINAGGTDVGTSQGAIVWETAPQYGDGGLWSTSRDPAAQAMAVARVGIRDAISGIVTPAAASYDATSGTWTQSAPALCRDASRVTVRCLAGAPLVDGQMDRRWAVAVARFAAAELPARICACDQANAQLYYWQFDLARTAGANDEQYGTTQEILACPFGTRRGAVFAWRQVLANQRAIGILA